MQMIRRDDRDRVDTVIARGFGVRHFAPVCIAACDTGFGSARLRALRIGRQRARHQFEPIVEPRRDSMHRADKRALPAADHAEPESSLWHRSHSLAICFCRFTARGPLAFRSRSNAKHTL